MNIILDHQTNLMNNSNNVAEMLRRAAEVISGGSNNGSSSSSTSNSSTSAPTNIVNEHRRLFNRQVRVQPYGRRQGRSSQKETTFSRTFVCLADKEQATVPSSSEKIRLRNSLLGERKVPIPTTASKERVKEVLFE